MELTYSISKEGSIITIVNGRQTVNLYDDPFVVNCDCTAPNVLCGSLPNASDKVLIIGWLADCNISIPFRLVVLNFSDFGYESKEEFCEYLNTLKGGAASNNLYTSDGQVTDAIRTVQGNSTNGLLFSAFAAYLLSTQSGSQLVVADEIELDTTANGSAIRFRSGLGFDFELYSGQSFAKNLKQKISSISPPVNPVYLTGEYLWYSESEQEDYYYDSAQSKWLSTKVYTIVFNDNNNTGNGVFLRFGNTLTSLQHGYPLTDKANVFAFGYTNINLLDNQVFTFFRANVPFLQQTIPSTNRVGIQLFDPVTVEELETIACQHTGTTNFRTGITLMYRKEHIEFALTVARVTDLGGGDYELRVEFIGSATQLVSAVEWNFEEPFPGPDPSSNPTQLVEVSAGVWTFSPQTFDGNASGITYDVTLTFTGGFNTQESVTVTIP